MEITNVSTQTVLANSNVLFTDTPIGGSCSIIHRDGSGLITIRGLTNQCKARFRISFGANVAAPAGTTDTPLILAISINGEPDGAATMITTPATAEDYWNVSSDMFIDVPRGVSYTISVKNIGTTSIMVQNANLIMERVA